MRQLIAALLVVAAVLSLHCLQDPRQVSSGGSFNVTLSNLQGSNSAGGSFQAKTIAGFYNGGDRRPGTDAGYSLITGTPNALDSETCKSVGLGFVGKPVEGQTSQLAFFFADGGVGDAGVVGVPPADGKGSLVYQEGCINKGKLYQWRSTGGSLTFTSVADAGETPQGALQGQFKDVKFTLTGATMAPDQDNGGATGTFTIDGDGEVQLFDGMNQQ